MRRRNRLKKIAKDAKQNSWIEFGNELYKKEERGLSNRIKGMHKEGKQSSKVWK